MGRPQQSGFSGRNRGRWLRRFWPPWKSPLLPSALRDELGARLKGCRVAGAVIEAGDSLRKLVGTLTFVELFFNRLAQFHIINKTQNKVGFWDFAELFERLIQGVVFRVRVEPSEELGGGRFLQLDG